MKKLLILVSMISMMNLIGCGSETFEPEVNDLAKAVLPGTWTDPTGSVAISFDENCDISGFTFTALPAELSGLTFDGSTFDIPIQELGMNVSASLTLISANVADDGTVLIEYQGQLEGFVGFMDPGYAVIYLNGSLDDVNNPTTFTGTVSAAVRPSATLQTLFGLEPEISIAADTAFSVNKS